MTTLNTTQLNFEEIKTNLREWMRQDSNFTDYDYEASGLSFLLDVLAYNTHYNAVLANFMANEMFIDTAQKRSSVLSHAKGVGYRPHGYIGARAHLSVVLTTGGSAPSYVIPRGTKFTTSINNKFYSFVTAKDYAASLASGTYTFPDVEVVEGSFNAYAWVVADADYTVKYEIPNARPDITTMVMRVYPNSTDLANPTYFFHSDTLIDVIETTKVFFTQEIDNEKMEFYFGNGVSVGVLPAPGSVINLEYVTSHGVEANGASEFSLVDQLPIGITAVVTASGPSFGGSDAEDIEEIRYNASKHFTVQNRAVTAFDYRAIINEQFHNILHNVVYLNGLHLDSGHLTFQATSLSFNF